MTDQLERELGELLTQLHVEMEPAPSSKTSTINIVCLYHKADRQEWARLEKHLDAAAWQFRQQDLGSSIARTSHECNPTAPTYRTLIEQATLATQHSHVVLVGLSVDMQRVLQQEEPLYNALLAKTQEAAEKERQRTGGIHVAGIRIRALLWEEHRFYGMRYFPDPAYEHLATQRHKDAACTKIAQSILVWTENIAIDRQPPKKKKRGNQP